MEWVELLATVTDGKGEYFFTIRRCWKSQTYHVTSFFTTERGL